MRVKPLGVTTLGDSSDGLFTIAPMPSIELTSPIGGEQWYATETHRISWTTVTIAQVRVEYSTNGGSSWQIATPGTTYVPASQGGYDWKIPDAPTNDAIVRITSVERPRFWTQGRLFSIIKGEIAIVSPNGGEKYEMAEQVDVMFNAPTSKQLDLFYSSDGGSSWHNVNPTPGVAIDASLGTVRLTMPSLPTRRAMLRIVDVERTWLADETDNVFEIKEAAGLQIFAPAQDDQLTRGSTTQIIWLANGIGRVHVEYSATGGVPPSSYVRIASNIDASVSTYTWNVPNNPTPNGRIRFISAVDGSTIAESGIFSIVDAPVAALRVESPNGGEVYDAGDKITVRWSGTNVPTVSLRFSSDAGVTWFPIAVNIPAHLRQYEWTAPNIGSARYRVAIESVTPAISDLSDADFEIKPSVLPSLGLLYPAGGEMLYAGDTVTVAWAMTGLEGPVTVRTSIDDGATWNLEASLGHDALSYSWIVPNTPTKTRSTEAGLMSAPTARIMVAQGALADTSGGFSIAVRQAPAVQVTGPNGGEMWREGQQVTIGWSFQVLQNVDIMISTDDGATWGTTVATNVAAAPMNYTYTVPRISNDPLVNKVRVRVSANPGGVPFDVSDAPFTYHPLGVAGVAENMSVREMTLFGAFPNPFATSTEVRWQQHISSPVTLRVYDAAGLLVAEKSTGTLAPGAHNVVLEAGSMPAGNYVYELRIGAASIRSRVTLTR
jgi:hypothetical protein